MIPAFRFRVDGRRFVAIALLAIWLVHGIPFLFSSAPDSQVAKGLKNLAVQQQTLNQKLKEKGLNTVETSKIEDIVGAELEISRATHLAITVLGLLAGIATFFAFRFWQLAAVLTSAIYIFLWYESGVMAHVSLIDAYRLKWEMATALSTQYRFLLEDVVVPFVLITSIVYVGTTFVPRQPQSPRE